MRKFWKFLINRKSRNEEIEALEKEIEELEADRWKEKSSHRLRQKRKYLLIEQIREKREEMQKLQLQTQEI